jgi:hypothetical protein
MRKLMSSINFFFLQRGCFVKYNVKCYKILYKNKKMARTKKTENNDEMLTQKQGRSLLVVVLAVLLVLAVAVAGYFYYQYKYVLPAKSETDEINSLTKIVGSMIELPEGETPTLATVTDKEKLAEQPFFQRAENGDKVLIYANTGRAILYRPSAKWYEKGKIIDVTTVNINQPTPAGAPDTTTPQTTEVAPATSSMPVSDAPNTVEKVVIQKISIAIYNGSAKIGVTNSLEDEIKAKFPDMEVTAKEKAAKNDYQGNLVVDLSGKNAEIVKNISDTLGGVIGNALPDGETKPEADILIIVGNKQ